MLGCFVCGHDLHTVYSGPEYNVVRCVRCGVTYVDPPPTVVSARSTYEGDSVLHFSEGRDRVLRQFLRIAERKLQRKGRLLDVGCGAGTFLALAQNRGWKAEGIDINPNALEFARAKLGLKVTEGLLRDVRESGAFDFVTFMQSLEYMTGHVDIMRAAYGLLNNGGLLGIDTPNLSFHRFRLVFSGEEAERGAGGLRVAPHVTSRIVLYTPRAAVLLLQRAGFKNVRVRPGAPRRIGGAVKVLERSAIYGLTSMLYRASFQQFVLSPTMFVFGQK